MVSDAGGLDTRSVAEEFGAEDRGEGDICFAGDFGDCDGAGESSRREGDGSASSGSGSGAGTATSSGGVLGIGDIIGNVCEEETTSEGWR